MSNWRCMMTSSNGNIFRVTGHLWGNSPVPGEFPTQRPVTRSFDVFFDLRPNKRLNKQSWGWWFETLSWSLWRHCNGSEGPQCYRGSAMLTFYERGMDMRKMGKDACMFLIHLSVIFAKGIFWQHQNICCTCRTFYFVTLCFNVLFWHFN